MNELVKASPTASAMAVATCERDPDENMERLLTALRGIGCSAVIKHKLTFQTDPKTGEMSGWRNVTGRAEIVVAEGADPARGLALIDRMMAPAAPPSIGVWLTELSHITAKRGEDADSAMLTMTAYIKRLVQYPGDVVRQTLQDWSGKWFPTWGELKEILDARCADRLAIRDALNGSVASKIGAKMPAAFDGMDEEAKVQWLLREAEWARRRGDPERFEELTEQASALEDKIRESRMET